MNDDVQNVPQPAEQPTAPVAPVTNRHGLVAAIAVAAVVVALMLSVVSFGAGVFVGRATNRGGQFAGPPPAMMQQGQQGRSFQGGPMGGGPGFDGGEQRGPRGGMRGGLPGGMRGAPGQLPTATPTP